MAVPELFKLHSIEEIEQIQPPPWLIKDIIPQGGFVVFYGEAGVGKTFVALDLAMCIGSGLPWNGHQTTQGPVVYIAAEGGFGFGPRVQAWKINHELTGNPPVFFLMEAVLFREEAFRTLFMMTLNAASLKPKLIVIDTFARSFVGHDESSAKDVSEFIHVLDRVRKITGAAVLLIHHVGKNSRRQERGSSALRGAADTMIHLKKSYSALSLECAKQKDAAEFENIPLSISVVELGDGASSCVVVDRAAEVTENTLTARQEEALEALKKFGPDGATSENWRKASGLGTSTFYRASSALQDAGIVTRLGLQTKGGRYTLVKNDPNTTTTI